MKNFIFILLTFIIGSLSHIDIEARNIEGYVTDLKRQPLDFAIIAIQNLSDSSLIVSSQTNENGYFLVETPQVPVMLRVSYIGFETFTKSIMCTNDTTLQIALNDNSTILEEVVVKATRPIVKLTEDGISTQISNTTLANSGTAIDVLDNMPLIQKTSNGLSVFGKGSPIIYINGRRIYDLSELERIKSQDIKNVEIITNPGSKYDASVTSVIKVRTNVIKQDNFAVDSRTSFLQSKYSGIIEQATIAFRKQQFNLFNNFSYKNIANETSRDVVQDIYTDSIWNFNLAETEYFRKQVLENTLSINYNISDKHLLGCRYTIKYEPQYNSNLYNYNQVLANNIYYDYLENKGKSSFKNHPSHHLNIYYNTTIANWMLDVDFNMFYNRNYSNSKFDEISDQSTDVSVLSSNQISNKFYDAKATISRNIIGGKFYFGLDYTLTKRKDNYTNDSHIVSSSQLHISEQQINPFMEYSHNSIIGLIKFGLRYENIHSTYTTYNNSQNIKLDYSKLFPNITFTSKLKNLQWQLNYTTRTKRPNYNQLSNNVVYINRFTLQSGNPFLKPEYIHNFSLQGIWKFIQFSIDYQDSRNAIIYWASQDNIKEAITTISYKNVKSIKRVVGTITASQKVGLWNPRLILGINQQFMTLKTDYQTIKLRKPLVYAKLINSFKFTESFDAILNFNYQSKGNIQNIYLNKPLYYIDLSLTKSFNKNKYSIQLKFNDILKTKRDGNVLYNEKMIMNLLNSYDSRSVSITFRYRFNSLKEKSHKNSHIDSEINRL